ncbi:YbaN family protein [Parvimonas sp. KA00067]|uniref:YbaN family protein n=1 Tax=Parvimonas sp. KA00067 TaxID=1588755 RepID=UPI000838BB27|nr:YbaN family protein [Parvimonas sp. KA00067]
MIIIFLDLGIIGIYLPFMPTIPFLLVAAYCFSKSSKKFNDYFMSTKLYKENILLIKNRKGITKKKKIKILTIITIFISVSFYLVNNLQGRIALVVLLVHYLYFIFKVKTL